MSESGPRISEKEKEKVFKKYIKLKRSDEEKANQGEEEEDPEVTKEKDRQAQIMLEKIFTKADSVSEDEYRKILTLADLRLLINSLTPENLLTANQALTTEGKDPSEVLKLLRKTINGRDETTGLQNRFALSDNIRQTIIEIIKTKDAATREEKLRHSGLVYIDVRGLKMVNDARHDHSDGDAFIARVADETKVVAQQIFAKVLGEGAVTGIFRDGGDEFSITFENSKYDLEEVVTREKITEIFPETITVTRIHKTVRKVNGKEITDEKEVTGVVEIRELALILAKFTGAEDETSSLKLIDLLSAILEQKLFEQKFVSELFPREVIEKHLKKGRPNFENAALATFDMPILTAQGAQTNFDVLKNTKHTYHKKILSDEEITNLSAADVVNAFMSAIRLSADQRTYAAKDAKNKKWMESSDPFEQLLIDLVSRNEITITYAETLRLGKEIVWDLHVKAKKQQQREKKHKAELKKHREAEKKRQIERYNQLNPDLLNGGGI